MEEVKTENNQKKRSRSGLIPGLFLLAFGIIFLLGNYGLITFDIGKLWPIFLIIPGATMLWAYFKQ
jgi:lia operon protein LiaF